MGMHLLYVALGGALGSVMRVLVGQAVAFPLGTLTVNVVGSFAIGLAFAAGTDKSPLLHPFLMLGLLGGFTTFSTFGADTVLLGQSGGLGSAALNLILHNALGILAVIAGMAVARAARGAA